MTTRTTASPPHVEIFPPPRQPHAPARWLVAIGEDVRNIPRFWPVVQNMVTQDLQVRYQRSMLGFLWTLLNPILMMTTLTLVFSQLMGQGEDPIQYSKYLFAGMVPWIFL